MTIALDSLKQFVAAYGGIVALLDAAIRSWPSPPKGWRRYEDYLTQLHQFRHDVAALLTLHGREAPENARGIVANVLGGCAYAKEAMERRPCPVDTLHEVR